MHLSRRQADRAYVVATTGSNISEQVVRYRDVGLVSLLAEDLDPRTLAKIGSLDLATAGTGSSMTRSTKG